MQVDERNLVDAGDSEDLSYEDRIQMYWMENKGFVIGCITLLALLVIGFNGMKMVVAHTQAKIQDEYARSVQNGTLESFAQEHSGKSLGSLAALQVADTAYTENNYSKAADFYTLALEYSGNDILKGRASLGRAFATFYGGDNEQGLAQLRSITADNSLPQTIRSEAAYHLAVDADVSGDKEAFHSYANQIIDTANAGQWLQRIQIYQQSR